MYCQICMVGIIGIKLPDISKVAFSKGTYSKPIQKQSVGTHVYA